MACIRPGMARYSSTGGRARSCPTICSPPRWRWSTRTSTCSTARCGEPHALGHHRAEQQAGAGRQGRQHPRRHRRPARRLRRKVEEAAAISAAASGSASRSPARSSAIRAPDPRRGHQRARSETESIIEENLRRRGCTCLIRPPAEHDPRLRRDHRARQGQGRSARDPRRPAGRRRSHARLIEAQAHQEEGECRGEGG